MRWNGMDTQGGSYTLMSMVFCTIWRVDLDGSSILVGEMEYVLSDDVLRAYDIVLPMPFQIMSLLSYNHLS
jgi:hypothetical protein